VIVRNPERLAELPRLVVTAAAALAARYSKARNAGKVEVHVCRVADVSKLAGGAPTTRIRSEPSTPRVS
jgi:predicted ribosome quality control (RQC) complex YloA/Tae2 family protein